MNLKLEEDVQRGHAQQALVQLLPEAVSHVRVQDAQQVADQQVLAHQVHVQQALAQLAADLQALALLVVALQAHVHRVAVQLALEQQLTDVAVVLQTAAQLEAERAARQLRRKREEQQSLLLR